MRKILVCFIGLLFAIPALGQVKVNLAPQWQTYDEELEVWRKGYVSGEPILFPIQVAKNSEAWLLISGDPNASLFIAKTPRVVRIGEEGQSIQVKTLEPYANQGVVWLTLVPSRKYRGKWKTVLSDEPSISHAQAQDEVILKVVSGYHDIKVVLWLFLLSVLVFLKKSSEKLFGLYFSVANAFAVNVREEQKLRLSIFDRGNLPFVFLLSSLIATLLFLSGFGNPQLMSTLSFFCRSAHWSSTLGHWFLWVVLCSVPCLIRWLGINLVSGIMNMRGIKHLHFHSFLAISLQGFLLVGVGALSLWLAFPGLFETILNYLPWLLSGILLLRIFLIFLKLRRATKYRNVHLISYLCTTEIAPAAIFLNFFYSI